MEFHLLSAEQSLEALGSKPEGLLEADVKVRQAQYGKNVVKRARHLSRLRIFARQFQSPLILILLVAGAITILLQDYRDATFILLAAFVNALLGFYQENKAEGALRALKQYVSETVVVLREGSELVVETKELVPGDIIRLEQGNKVPADARLLFENDLNIDEALLTGESLPQDKSTLKDGADTVLADRKSMLYSGTTLVQGRARALVTAIGAETEIGKIASLVTGAEREETPLQKALSKLAIKIGYVVVIIAAGLFALTYFSGTGLLDSFLISVAILVAAVPEGLPIVMTVILAIGVERLAKKKGVVRRLSAAETLGSTSIILTDKTGTLTQAKMDLAQVEGIDGLSEELVVSMALLNADIVIENPQSDPAEWNLIGKPLEKSLVQQAALRHQIYLPDLERQKKTLDFLPFNSRNKFSAIICESDSKVLKDFSGKMRVLSALGAPEVLLERSALSEVKRKQILDQVEALTRSGRRVIAVGFKFLNSDKHPSLKESSFISGLEHFGLLSFEDPLRPGVKAAFERVSAAGVRTIIVTGDHSGTAISVAQELGMQMGADSLLEGGVLDGMTEAQLDERLESLVVVSRVSPEGKMKLASAFQKKGFVVAMSGDGVNDAPA
ncbi:MAG: cation-transporting P-type ATPase, partial [Candidatus Harrisonbacteria bacterium]|nr:cation-transporting P-type ATPase [Candidatus Harrisonbacteria bacterium]